MAATPTAAGYWLVASDGGIFSFGDARSTARRAASRSTSRSSAWPPRPTAAATGSSASDGGIFAFGDATVLRRWAPPLNGPVVAMAATRTGRGYWMVASDGGVFASATRPSRAVRACPERPPAPSLWTRRSLQRANTELGVGFTE